MRAIVDVFKEVVDKAEDIYDRDLYYEHGHILEINNTLIGKEKSINARNRKYPLIMLLQPFTETVQDIGYNVNLRLMICSSTKSDIKAQERYEKVFNPVLYPIYDSLMEALRRSKYFSWSGGLKMPPHTKTDRPFLGVSSENGNIRYIMSDKLDAIEITNLNLFYKDLKC